VPQLLLDLFIILAAAAIAAPYERHLGYRTVRSERNR
jgi:hypothetical protein